MKIPFQKYTLAFAMVSVLALTTAYTMPVFASGDHAEQSQEGKGEHGKEEGGEHGEESKLTIDPQVAADMKMEIAEVSPATINISIPVTGKVALNKNAIAEVHGRFEGIVKSVSKTEGEMVKAGDTLATVESNESLQVYAVKSPINGIILERNTNVGHTAGAESMFKIADLSKLWVEFNVFSRDISKVEDGQKIRITLVGNHMTAETAISSILPVADSASQTVIARAQLDNAEGKWRAGMSVHGEILTAEKSVPVAVAIGALQRNEGNTVVFVQEEGGFEARPVKLGLQDATHAEVLEGLQAGEKYVSSNSFVLKAQAGKAGAEHAH